MRPRRPEPPRCIHNVIAVLLYDMYHLEEETAFGAVCSRGGMEGANPTSTSEGGSSGRSVQLSTWAAYWLPVYFQTHPWKGGDQGFVFIHVVFAAADEGDGLSLSLNALRRVSEK